MTILKVDLPLRRGCRGASVKALQEALNRHGHSLLIDGIFGAATEQAVMAYQRQQRLVVDGIVGEKTYQRLTDPQAADRFLTDADLVAAADTLGVDVAAVRAITEVEARGSGFLPSGRPKILYERHIMYRRLRERGIDPSPYLHSHPDLVNTVRGGYLGGEAEHDRLNAASSINLDAAIEATSWGIFQIMGFHWMLLGYNSASAYATAMAESEAAQLEAFVRFIQADPELHEALREHRWDDVAAIYNGPAYAEHAYHTRLEAAYQRYRNF